MNESLYECIHHKRIMVIGCQGSGKSYFSETLSKKTNIPCIHLDDYFWDSGWIQVSEDKFKAFQETIYQNEKYIIDGLYMDSIAERIDNVDLIIFLDIPRWICTLSVIWRTLDNFFTGRNLPQKIKNDTNIKIKKPIKSWRFLFHLINVFYTQQREQILEILQYKQSIDFLIFKRRKDINKFLGEL